MKTNTLITRKEQQVRAASEYLEYLAIEGTFDSVDMTSVSHNIATDIIKLINEIA